MSPAPHYTAATHPPTPAAPTTAEGYYPLSTPSAGSALPADEWKQNKKLPLLFTPQKIGGRTFRNRIHVAPMCQYSASQSEKDAGVPTAWHMVHLGNFAVRGAAVVIAEATGVLPNGRISPACLGLWNDAQRDAFKPIFSFIKSQGALAGIQLAHAGRKASNLVPWVNNSLVQPQIDEEIATIKGAGGWENVWAPSAIPFAPRFAMPVEMTLEDIEEFKSAWKAAVSRADEAGVDVVEIHSAHGYLMHEFLSPFSNKRTDKYGGSLENRMRLALEIVEITRATLPADKPVFMRISATDNHIHGEKNEQGEYISWGLEQSKVLLAEVSKRGVDLLDVSSSGNDVNQKIKGGPGYQVPFADELRASLPADSKTLISAVGIINTGTEAEAVLQSGKADAIAVGREFLRHGELVFDWAQELGTAVNVPQQYQYAYNRMLKRQVDESDDKDTTASFHQD